MGRALILPTTSTATTGAAFRPGGEGNRSFQAVGGTTSGVGAAVIQIQVSNDGVLWLPPNNVDNTISLTLGTTSVNDGFAMDASWDYVQAKVISISGTGAGVYVMMGTQNGD